MRSTFHPFRDNSPRRQFRGAAGFTLIELMIVVAIIALVTSMVIPSISSYFQVSITSASREMATWVKETYNTTVITGQVHRMVYDFKDGSYWAEWGPDSLLLDTKESKERETRKKRLSFTSDKPPPSQFAMDKTITKRKIALPTGVSFEDVITQQSSDPLTEGQGYTHFFPHGLIEKTIIHLKDTSQHHVSLVISPVLGKTDMYEHYVTEKEAFGK